MSNLPEEVLADILSLLPVSLLLFLRLVCKIWRKIIDSPEFINLHLSRSLHRHVIARDEHLHTVSFDSIYNSSVVTLAKIQHHPLWCQDYGTEVWGSCNGLLCLSNSLDTLAIWNFSTRKSRKLPYAPIEFEDLTKYVDTRIYGFGYDKSSDDYKVVRIVVLKTKSENVLDNEVKVYSLKSHTWHRVQKFPKGPNVKRTGGVFVGGCLHWLVTERLFALNDGEIVMFDLTREVFGSVEQPNYTDTGFYKGLHCLGGCLSISCNYFSDHVDIWIMKEYGVKESWTKLVSINQMGLTRLFQYMHPTTYSKSGSELLLEEDADKFLWYDMERKTRRVVKVRGMRGLMQVDVCVESLIPLDVVADSSNNKQKETEERDIRNWRDPTLKYFLSPNSPKLPTSIQLPGVFPPFTKDRLGAISCRRGSNWSFEPIEGNYWQQYAKDATMKLNYMLHN